MNLDVDYVSGPEVEKLVEDALTLTPEVKEKLVSLIGSKKGTN